jgi:hypothetical protein
MVLGDNPEAQKRTPGLRGDIYDVCGKAPDQDVLLVAESVEEVVYREGSQGGKTLMGYCITCKKRWEAKAIAHCTGCHKTFKSVNAFDQHRKAGKCLDPASIGMSEKDGVWRKEFTGAGFWAKGEDKGVPKPRLKRILSV